jgi:hypothetical protein
VSGEPIIVEGLAEGPDGHLRKVRVEVRPDHPAYEALTRLDTASISIGETDG